MKTASRSSRRATRSRRTARSSTPTASETPSCCPSCFRRPSVLAEPSVGLLDAGMLAVFVHLVGRLAAALAGEAAARRWQLGALVALAAAVAAAALVGRAFFGAVGGFPLADLV